VSELQFSEQAWSEYLEWQTLDKKTVKKINTLLTEIQRHPFSGEGKPEPLKGTSNWSRRINAKDRLVYEAVGSVILIKQCKGHYNDR